MILRIKKFDDNIITNFLFYIIYNIIILYNKVEALNEFILAVDR
jgi:hypothetical protein